MKLTGRLAIPLFLLILVPACEGRSASEMRVEEASYAREIVLSSSAFSDGEEIPEIYTCDGDDISPPLSWTNIPEETASLALIVDDPDAPGEVWVHWIVYNISPDTRGLPEGSSSIPLPEGAGMSGENSWGRIGYGGPCPPRGTHRYQFKLYALDSMVFPDSGADNEAFLESALDHIIDMGQMTGTYSR